jgi:Leucine-rich repeat (LRR) protein
MVDGSGITGTLPSEIGRCSQLEKLMMINTRIMGSLPTEIGKLSFLKDLELNSNYFLTSTLPTDFYSLSQLTSLRLALTNVAGNLPPNFCSQEGRKIYVSSVQQFKQCTCCKIY